MFEYGIVLARSFISFLVTIVFVRLAGKKQLAELTLMEFVIAITIGSISASATVDLGSSALHTAFGIATWAILAVLMSQTDLYNRGLSRLINSRPRVLIDGGRISKDALRLERLTMEDLIMLLRKKGVFELNQVEVAVLERDGTISVLRKSQFEPVTPRDLGISTEYRGLPTTLILDGHIQDENLREINQDKNWLLGELRSRGITDPGRVNYMAIDTTGSIYVDVDGGEDQGGGDKSSGEDKGGEEGGDKQS